MNQFSFCLIQSSRLGWSLCIGDSLPWLAAGEISGVITISLCVIIIDWPPLASPPRLIWSGNQFWYDRGAASRHHQVNLRTSGLGGTEAWLAHLLQITCQGDIVSHSPPHFMASLNLRHFLWSFINSMMVSDFTWQYSLDWNYWALLVV